MIFTLKHIELADALLPWWFRLALLRRSSLLKMPVLLIDTFISKMLRQPHFFHIVMFSITTNGALATCIKAKSDILFPWWIRFILIVTLHGYFALILQCHAILHLLISFLLFLFHWVIYAFLAVSILTLVISLFFIRVLPWCHEKHLIYFGNSRFGRGESFITYWGRVTRHYWPSAFLFAVIIWHISFETIYSIIVYRRYAGLRIISRTLII